MVDGRREERYERHYRRRWWAGALATWRADCRSVWRRCVQQPENGLATLQWKVYFQANHMSVRFDNSPLVCFSLPSTEGQWMFVRSTSRRCVCVCTDYARSAIIIVAPVVAVVVCRPLPPFRRWRPSQRAADRLRFARAAATVLSSSSTRRRVRSIHGRDTGQCER